MSLEVAAAAILTVLFLAGAAVGQQGIGGVVRLGRRPAPGSGPAGIGRIALALFCILSGIWVGLGAAPGNAAAGLGALLGCMAAFDLGLDRRTFGRALSWFCVICWSSLTGYVASGSFWVQEAHAVHAIWSAPLLSSDLALAASCWLALTAGLVAAAAWSRQLGPRIGSVAALQAGAHALAVVVLCAGMMGPMASALIRGPLDRASIGGSAASLSAVVTSIVVSGWLSRHRLDSRWVLWPATVASLIGLAAAVAVTWS